MIMIYCFLNGKWAGGPDVRVAALSEDGRFLAHHISSSESWAKVDIGISSTSKHDHYTKECPEGFDLVWIDDAGNDDRVLQAYARYGEFERTGKDA